ncbi:hypothetical protein BC940DRAFT_133481 [Gongronella butleri]|nr:hypothetical protein BC940DRAFT_133481 [Gongronella butleri]
MMTLSSCAHGGCCSPSKLWRQVQAIVKSGSEADWGQFCSDQDRAPHVARVLCTQRVANDAALYPASHKHRLLQFPAQQRVHAQRVFGASMGDLNGLQMALVLRRQEMALAILEFMHAQHQLDAISAHDLQLFVNHVWGHGHSALHVAAYWGMTAVVRLLLACGADPQCVNARSMMPVDVCPTSAMACRQLLLVVHKNNKNDKTEQKTRIAQQNAPVPAIEPVVALSLGPTPVSSSAPTVTVVDADASSTISPALPRTSMLLKKAIQQVADLPLDDATTLKHPPKLLYSSSTSSSSSMSSLEDQMPPTPDATTALLCFPSSSPTIAHAKTPNFRPLPPFPAHPRRDTLHSITRPLPPVPVPEVPPKDVETTINTHLPSMERLATPEPLPPALISRTPTPANRLGGIGHESMIDNDPPRDQLPAQPEKEASQMKKTKKKKTVRFCPEVIVMHACTHGDMDDLQALMEQYGSEGEKDMGRVLEQWQDASYRACQLPGVSKNTSSSMSWLHLAILYRQPEIAQYLIDLGCNVNAIDHHGRTPLHYAAMFAQWQTLVALSRHPQIYLHPKSHTGQRVYDCPRAIADQRRCRGILDRAVKQQQLQQQQRPLPLPRIITRSPATTCI